MERKISRIRRINGMLRILIVVLAAALALFLVKCLAGIREMKADLENKQAEIDGQRQENREMAHVLEDEDYRNEQLLRGRNDYCRPEEKTYIISQ